MKLCLAVVIAALCYVEVSGAPTDCVYSCKGCTLPCDEECTDSVKCDDPEPMQHDGHGGRLGGGYGGGGQGRLGGGYGGGGQGRLGGGYGGGGQGRLGGGYGGGGQGRLGGGNGGGLGGGGGYGNGRGGGGGYSGR